MSMSLPAPREGEMLYSVLARHARYLNADEAGPFAEVVLGRRHAIASVDLPGGLSGLVRYLAVDDREHAIDVILDRLTGFPFHTAFVSEDVRASVRSAMRGDVTGVYARLGLATFKVRPPDRLRFCPECLGEMEAVRGDLWWRREHQLPGVPVCWRHGCVLRVSEVAPGDRNRHTFVPATRDACPPDAETAVEAEGDALARLAELAALAAGLLTAPPEAREAKTIVEGYRRRLADVGLMRSPRRVDHEALLAAFRTRWGDLPSAIEGLGLSEDFDGSWLSALVRGGRRAAHPLQHLLLTGMLDRMEDGRAFRPFGTGPWTCRNPLAGHHGEPVIDGVRVRRDRGAVYGDFGCSCGYLYTVGIAANGSVGLPKYRRFGPLLLPALGAALARGDGLRRTAAAFGLDPKTLLREAAIAGVAVPWSTAPSGMVPVASPNAERNVERRPRGPRRPRRNWFAIDARLARSARQVAAAILVERPPVRVTLAEVERQVSRPDWIVKRTAKLPMTVAAMKSAVEDTDAFRRRRLDWCVSLAVERGDLRPCEVLREAGLPTAWLPQVRDAVQVAMAQARRVA